MRTTRGLPVRRRKHHTHTPSVLLWSALGLGALIVAGLVAAVIVLAVESGNGGDSPPSTEYDYVVVGGGAAGCLIANRLSASGAYTVLLVEAGDDLYHERPIYDSAYAPLIEEQYSWRYYFQAGEQPQTPYAERPAEYVNGRLLGGGTAVNGEQYVDCSEAAWNRVAALTGDEAYSFESARAAMKRTETFYGPTDDPAARGYAGPIDVVSRPTPAEPAQVAAEKFVAAVGSAPAAGFGLPQPEIVDYNDPNTPYGAFQSWQLTQYPNTTNRVTSATAFLTQDVLDGRPNLHVTLRSTATRVVWQDGNLARGVRYLRDGAEFQALARRSVVVSAGLYSSKLLELSGVGNATLLAELGVSPLVADLPRVGTFKNQLVISAVMSANPEDIDPDVDPTILYTGGAFLPDPAYPNMSEPRATQLIGIAVPATGDDDAHGRRHDGPTSPGTFVIAAIDLRPINNGQAHIQSLDPLTNIAANEHWLADDADVARWVAIFKKQVLPIGLRMHEIDPQYDFIAPPLSVLQDEDDDALIDYFRATVDHTHHWQGGIAMAPAELGGVVDSDGRVYGTRQLIVADASILPTGLFGDKWLDTCDGNPQRMAYTIGEIIATKMLT